MDVWSFVCGEVWKGLPVDWIQQVCGIMEVKDNLRSCLVMVGTCDIAHYQMMYSVRIAEDDSRARSPCITGDTLTHGMINKYSSVIDCQTCTISTDVLMPIYANWTYDMQHWKNIPVTQGAKSLPSSILSYITYPNQSKYDQRTRWHFYFEAIMQILLLELKISFLNGFLKQWRRECSHMILQNDWFRTGRWLNPALNTS